MPNAVSSITASEGEDGLCLTFFLFEINVTDMTNLINHGLRQPNEFAYYTEETLDAEGQETMIECSKHYIQCGLINFKGDELLCEGIAPHHLDAMDGEFILCKDKPEHFGYVFLVGPVVEDKFDLFLFGSRFHIDQTTGIEEIPAYVREELIATISGEW